jgi:hypothetical protein
VRERLVSQPTGIPNEIHAFMLERGIAVRHGIGFLRTELPTILAMRTDPLSPRMLRVIEEFAGTCAVWISASMAYLARSKHWPVKIRNVGV